MEITKQKIEEWKSAIEDEYNIKLKALQREREKQLGAIDIILGLEESAIHTAATILSAPKRIKAKDSEPFKDTSGENETKSTPMTQLIREAIGSTNEPFNLTIISNMIHQQHPEKTVSRNSFHSVISKMRNKGDVIVDKPGRGKIPAMYKKIGRDEDPLLI